MLRAHTWQRAALLALLRAAARTPYAGRYAVDVFRMDLVALVTLASTSIARADHEPARAFIEAGVSGGLYSFRGRGESGIGARVVGWGVLPASSSVMIGGFIAYRASCTDASWGEASAHMSDIMVGARFRTIVTPRLHLVFDVAGGRATFSGTYRSMTSDVSGRDVGIRGGAVYELAPHLEGGFGVGWTLVTLPDGDGGDRTMSVRTLDLLLAGTL
jgi:hypothetical protein